MVNWLHILWAFPAFIVGFFACALLTGGKLEEIETDLYRERAASRTKCERCGEKQRADAAEGDKKALIEEIATARRTNGQLRGMIDRLQAKVWRQMS